MYPESRRIIRTTIFDEKITNDYLRKGKDEISEYVCTTNGKSTVSMGYYKIEGEKLEHLQKVWKSGEIVDKLQGQTRIKG